MFEIKSKVLYKNLDKAFVLMQEMILETVLDDEKRLHEIISEARSRVQASFMSSGHTVAKAACHVLFFRAGRCFGTV